MALTAVGTHFFLRLALAVGMQCTCAVSRRGLVICKLDGYHFPIAFVLMLYLLYSGPGLLACGSALDVGKFTLFLSLDSRIR